MDEPVRRVDQTTTRTDDSVTTAQEVHEPAQQRAHKQSVVARLVWFIAGVINVLLAFRFLFVLLGANSANSFANFIYSASHPFAAPFFGLFGYATHYGVSRVEFSTLVAIIVYSLVAYGISRLVTITQD